MCKMARLLSVCGALDRRQHEGTSRANALRMGQGGLRRAGVCRRGQPALRRWLGSGCYNDQPTHIERTFVNVQQLLLDLKAERERIDHAIATLEGLASPSSARRGRPPKTKQAASAPRKKRPTMSAAARARISGAMKKRWAALRQGSAPKHKPTAKSVGQAARKRISGVMKY